MAKKSLTAKLADAGLIETADDAQARHFRESREANKASLNQQEIMRRVSQVNDYLDLSDDAYVLLLQTIRDTQNPILIAKCLQVAFAHGRAVTYKALAGQAERSEQYVEMLIDLQSA